jgi:Domain of unknown function (DUF222)
MVAVLLDDLTRISRELRSALADLDPERLDGADAARLLDVFAVVEKLASGGKLLAARRVESSNVWRRDGHRSAAAHLAQATGTALGPAIATLEAARHLGSLPATDEALRNGKLSETQVKEITNAAIVHPESEQELVDAAAAQPVNVLKLRCRRVRAAGKDLAATYEAIRRGRYLKNWVDHDGAVRFDARLTPDDGARLLNVLKGATDRLVRDARAAGIDEPRKARAADALVSLVCDRRTRRPADAASASARRNGVRGGSPETPPTEPTATVHVQVDHAALVRGSLEPGEICEIPGVGPIPVDVARRLAVDSVLSVLVTDGVDVSSVAHSGRTIPAALRRALVERDPTCVVPGCEQRHDLEIDHLEPFASGGPTSLANLVRLCHWHHELKTYHRHRLERDGDGWRWVLPMKVRSTTGIPSG